MAKGKNITVCGVIFSDTLSACDTCKINKSTQQKHRKTSRPNLPSERIKLVSTDLPGYAYMAKFTDNHSRVKAASFIEESPSVLPTADSATSQARARQLALQCQDSPKQHFEIVSQYIKAVGMDKINQVAFSRVLTNRTRGITLQRTSVSSVRHSYPYPELLEILYDVDTRTRNLWKFCTPVRTIPGVRVQHFYTRSELL